MNLTITGMPMHTRFLTAGFALLALASSVSAQERPPLRPLGPVVATTTETFGPLVTVRHTRAGLLVNDVRNRKVVLLDSTLALTSVVADTTPATANAYSGRTAALVPYPGDSTLFIDPASMSMLMLDPWGKVTRVMSVPRTQDAGMLGSAMAGAPAVDAAGRLVYRGMPVFERRIMRQRGEGGGPPAMPEFPDTTPVVRVDLATRAVDTLAWLKVPRIRMSINQDSAGRMRMSAIMNPLPVVDDWAVMSDGSVAVVRGQDYRIDWVRPDGTRETSPKIPFDWRRLSDEDKVAFLDSVKAQRERMAAADSTAASRVAERAAERVAAGGRPARGAQRQMQGGGARQMIVQGGGGQMQTFSVGGPGGGGGLTFVDPHELPDYQPVFFANAARADADGHLWVQTIPTRAIGGGPVHDVIDLQGRLVDRVQIPEGRRIIGFGPGGIVYLAVTKDETTTIEKALSR